MSPLRPGSRSVKPVDPAELSARAAALAEAVRQGRSQVGRVAAGEAERVVAKVTERNALAGGNTVVALAGATGSGKSSLFNALVGADVSTVGARRPTTSSPTAAIWGVGSAGALLDWVGVPTRHLVDPADQPGVGQLGSLDGLVLLDLPDFDSRNSAHRVEAERVLELTDVFVWVTDPQKYADAVLHDEFVRESAGHEVTTIVVLNQVDRLSEAAVKQCITHLRTLLEADGMHRATVVPVSARTGAGMAQLRQAFANAIAGHNAAQHRLAVDLTEAAKRLRRDVADSEASIGPSPDRALVDALGRSAGVPLVLDAVEAEYRREALGRTGWLFTRWASTFGADPLGRLHLSRDGITIEKSDARVVLGRSSVPPPSPAARAAVDLTTRKVADDAATGLPSPWLDAVHDASTGSTASLSDALDQAVLHTPLRARGPVWWRVFGILQWVLGFCAVVGLLWLVVLGIVRWASFDVPPPPTVWIVPVPFLLLALGLLGGLLLAALAVPMAKRGAIRRRGAIEKRLGESIGQVAVVQILAPIDEVLARHRATREQLDRVTGG